jgi:hypothetical protein
MAGGHAPRAITSKRMDLVKAFTNIDSRRAYPDALLFTRISLKEPPKQITDKKFLKNSHRDTLDLFSDRDQTSNTSHSYSLQ